MEENGIRSRQESTDSLDSLTSSEECTSEDDKEDNNLDVDVDDFQIIKTVGKSSLKYLELQFAIFALVENLEIFFVGLEFQIPTYILNFFLTNF